MKTKEPFIAVILSIIVTGLGQFYAGKYLRGGIFLFLRLFFVVWFYQYVVNPNTAISSFYVVVTNVYALFNLFVVIDSYFCARSYNIHHNLIRTITWPKRGLYFLGVLLSVLIYFISMFALVIYIRQNYIQAFALPSESMLPTIEKDDKILVDKQIYRHIDPQRGDVVVFIYPGGKSKKFAKRIVGLPNESLEIKYGNIVINGVRLNQKPFNDFYYYNRGDFGAEGELIHIPANSYYVIGDHSESSYDSRYWGFVPKENIAGKAFKIWFPYNRSGPIH